MAAHQSEQLLQRPIVDRQCDTSFQQACLEVTEFEGLSLTKYLFLVAKLPYYVLKNARRLFVNLEVLK